MTNEEAISIVRCWVRSRGAYTDHATWQTNNEVAKLAIEALEKQIPKKPIARDAGSYCDDISVAFDCPVCGCTVGDEYDVDDPMNKYCFACGQAIDWEDTE